MTMESLINIIIVDDNPAFSESLSILLGQKNKYNILAKFSSGIDLLNYPNLGHADLILLDIEMPGLNGFETAKRIGFRYHQIKLIAITMYQDKVYLEQLIGSGFKGFINKTEVAEKIDIIIKNVLSNQFKFPGDIKIIR
jgi:DNA-binding NarL/FixJ family response regulator